MKYLILITFILTSLFSKNHVFLIEEYDKEIDLEAKIITKIAKDILKNDFTLYIPNITPLEKRVYSKYVHVANSCNDASFIYAKKELDTNVCSTNNKIIFTNNYNKLMNENIYIGAFFWSKSRPNITFIKSRLNKHDINLPLSYKRYIESF